MPEDKPGARMRQAAADKLALLVEKRRLVVRLVAAAVAVAFLLIIPGYLSSRSEFLERYESMDAAYRSWASSTHAEVACRSCHVSPRRVSRSLYALRMLGEFYVSTVIPSRQPKLFGKPTHQACESCHQDIRQASPTGDLKIPHRAHVRVLKLECVHCHSYVVHEANPEGKHTPRMATCLKCHDGVKARRDCVACHQDKDAPANHRTAAWLVEHPNRQKELDCKKCHAWTEGWCRQCHSRRPASHAGKWRGNHRFKVQKHRNCEACHKSEFCVKCHGEVPKLNFDAGLKYVE